MVKHHDFKRCEQSGFCKRNRDLADSMILKGRATLSPYQIDRNSVKLKNGQLEASVIKTISASETVKLPLIISLLDRGMARVVLDEEKRQNGQIELRHGSKARKERYNEAADWALTGAGLQAQKSAKLLKGSKEYSEVTWGPANEFRAVIRHAPFGIDFFTGQEKQITLNDRG